ncbi:hypothetical protein RvY_13116 [Ramazzottius varieornatus]|uniref:Cyclic nucleotide-binding domain-containing protein n=1 Tax=Ramazzottius varieornatus TaxID=947166 RepID=A0A1D1VNP5_RAMVA|nr:hypothetical protein RvY_13116 [Ramazzottius varieornatus]
MSSRKENVNSDRVVGSSAVSNDQPRRPPNDDTKKDNAGDSQSSPPDASKASKEQKAKSVDRAGDTSAEEGDSQEPTETDDDYDDSDKSEHEETSEASPMTSAQAIGMDEGKKRRLTIEDLMARIPSDFEDPEWSLPGETDESEPDDDSEPEYEPPAVIKLRALARVVMMNLRWAKDNRRGDAYRGFETTYKDPSSGEEKQVFFKVSDFFSSKRVLSGLTEEEKTALNVHPIGRTVEDIQTITRILERYKCFDKFAPPVRQQLAVWARYDTFDDGRVLLRQGHEPYSMYFILTGSVNFKASDSDPRSGRTNYYPLGVRGPSSIIGEIELLNNDERRSTGVTQGDVELLRVDEDPFNEILRTSFEAIWADRFAVLQSAQMFASWSDAELRILNENSSVIAFGQNKPILSDVSGQSAFTYIVQKGRCAMVKDVILERLYFGKNKTLMYQSLEADDERRWLPPSQLKNHPELEGRHLFITEFKEGDYFGVGEDLRRTHIIALTMVECLTIPRSVFEKANRVQFLEDLKADLEDAIPSDEQILEDWLALETWKQYKKKHLKFFYSKKQAEKDYQFFDMFKKYR